MSGQEHFLLRSAARTGRAEQTGLPVLIGVAGHRDLRDGDLPTLEGLVSGVLRELLDAYRHTSCVILSPLAEGADRLVARVGLRLGMRLVAVLPMPRALYEEEFSRAESKREFEGLLTQAESCVELPLVDGGTPDCVRLPGPSRDRQYAQLAAFLTQHNQFLIVLWDGVHSGPVGGTSRIVRYQLDGVLEPFGPARSVLDVVETGPVIHVVTPRRSNAKVEGAFTLRRLYPKGWSCDEEAGRFFVNECRNIDHFNRDAQRLAPPGSAQVNESAEWLLLAAEAKCLWPDLQALRGHFAVADSLAIRFQRICARTLVSLFLLGALAMVFVGIYAHLSEHAIFLWLYLGSLAAGFSLFGWARLGHWQDRYQDYRALAEGLRVAFFWRLAGLRESVADHYLRKQRGELDWIREALRACCFRPAPAGEEGNPTQTLAAVLKHWVADQRSYYQRATRRDHRLLGRLELTATLLFGTAVVLAAVQAFLPERLEWLVFAMVTAPLAFGLLGAYAQKRGLQEHGLQYERMWKLFERAEQAVSAELDRESTEDARAILFELGKEALLEHGDWLHLHRSQRIELPR